METWMIIDFGYVKIEVSTSILIPTTIIIPSPLSIVLRMSNQLRTLECALTSIRVEA